MKAFKLFSLIMLLGALFTLGSCDKDDDDPTTADVYLICKVNGADFSANPLTIGGVATNGALRVQGNTSAGESIVMTLNTGYNGEGTYGFGQNFVFSGSTAIYIPNATNPLESYAAALFGNNAGEITVTSDDGTYVEGTFQFNCANQQNTSQTANITEGEFRMKLP